MNPKIRYNSCWLLCSELRAIPWVVPGRKDKPWTTEAWLFNKRNETHSYFQRLAFLQWYTRSLNCRPRFNPLSALQHSENQDDLSCAQPGDEKPAPPAAGRHHPAAVPAESSDGCLGCVYHLALQFCSGADSSWLTLLVVAKVFYTLFVFPEQCFLSYLLWVPPEDNTD